MVRLADIPPDLARALANTPLPEFESLPWAAAPPLAQARVAIVSTAGLHRRQDENFHGGATDFRLIPADVDLADLVMSHVSTNFDRSGFQQDVSLVFPLAHLRALEAAGEIGSVAKWHYAFMGATDPARLKDSGAEVGRLLREDGVTAALLVPV